MMSAGWEWMAWPCCCGVECPGCLGGVAPEEILVEISGMVIGEFSPCEDCEKLDLSWSVPWDSYIGYPVFACLYNDSQLISMCGLEDVLVEIDLYISDLAALEYKVRVDLYPAICNGNKTQFSWRKSYADSPPDCVNFNEESLPWLLDDQCGCTNRSATCKLTAI